MKKRKRFFNLNVRKLLVFLIVLALLLPQMTIVAFAANNEVARVTIDSACTYIKNAEGDGIWWTNSDTGEEYFEYSTYASKAIEQVTLYYTDGSTYTDKVWEVESRTGWTFETYDDQTQDTPWGVGKHLVSYEFGNFSGQFEVEVVESPFASVELTYTQKVYENITGSMVTDYDTGKLYFNYDIDTNYVDMTVTCKDGTVYTGNPWELSDELGYLLQLDVYSQAEEPLRLGHNQISYTFADLSGTMDLEILENPIQSVEVVNRETLYENIDGYWRNDYETGEKYFEYSLPDYELQFTVTYRDGTVVRCNGWEVEDETGFDFTITTEQSAAHQLKRGKNTIQYTYAGLTGTFEVEIVESPIQSVEILNSLQFREGLDGNWSTDYDTGETYYEYIIDNQILNAKVVYKNGSVYTGSISDIEDDTDFAFSFDTHQSSTQPWTVGTHQVDYTYGDLSGSFTVEVVENPVSSVTVQYNDVLYEGVDGRWANTWDESEKYFEYQIDEDALTVTVQYNDGTSFTGDLYQAQDEVGAYIHFSDSQSSSSPWGIGRHTVEYTLAGHSGSFSVEVVENPIRSVQVTCSKSFQYMYDGVWNYFEGENYFSYDIDYSDLDLTIRYHDGSVVQCSAAEVEDKTGFWFSADCFGGILSGNATPWEIGSNEVEYTFAGLTGTFDVEVTESPVKSIEFVHLRPLIENQDGEQTYEDYYKYIYDFSFRVNYTDGTSEVFYGYPGMNDGNRLCYDTQSANSPWHVGGQNIVTVCCGGVTAEYNMQIQPADPAGNEYTFIQQDSGIIITSYIGNASEIKIPSEIGGQSVIGIQDLGYSDEITSVVVPDSVKFLGDQWAANLSALKTVQLGKNITELTPTMFFEGYVDDPFIQSVTVSADNPYLMDRDGVVYTKDGTTLVFYPFARGKDYTVPNGVTNIDLLFDYNNYTPSSQPYKDINVIANSDNFVSEDGVLYTKGKQKVLKCSTDKSGSYVMPESVTEIADYAFSGCAKLTSVQVSSNVESLPNGAFFECSSLQSVTMPGVSSIGDRAFESCIALRDLSSKPLTALGEYCFASCSALKAVELGSGLTNLPDSVFEDCSSLKSITIPNSVTTMGSSVFRGCSSLTQATIPSSVTQMSDFTFYRCAQLKSVTIAGKIEYLGGYTFGGCVSLSEISLPDSIRSISDSVGFDDTPYYSDESHWDSYGVLYIDNYLIKAKEDISGSYTMKSGTLAIAAGAFQDCASLSGVQIPSSVVTIGYSAFEDCSKLTDVSMADGIRSIEDDAFFRCISLRDISIPDTVTYLGSCVFDYCSSLTNVKMSSSVKELNYKVFANCPKLKIDFLDGIETIGWCAFSDSAVETDSLVIPDSVTSIVYYAFDYNVNLANIEIPDHFVSIEQESFSNTKWFNNQPDGLVYLGDMLYTCKGNAGTSITVAPGTKWISAGALAGQPLEEVALPEGLQMIGANAFINSFMKEIYIPASVTEIQDCALGYYRLIKNNGVEFKKLPDFTIYGYAGTEAERYANDNGFAFAALTQFTDTSTGVAVLPGAGSSLPENTVLTVETLSSSPTRVCYDISLTADGQAVQPDGAVAVKIPVPAGMDGAACKVYRAETDGTYTDMNAAYADGYLTFTTDHFSEYVVTAGDPADVPGADLLGDVDGNGMVNAADAVMVLRSDAGLTTLTAEQTAAADVTGDGTVNASDAVQILRFDAGLITEL